MMSTLPKPGADAGDLEAVYRRCLRTEPEGSVRLPDGGDYRMHWPGCPDPHRRLLDLLQAEQTPHRRIKSSRTGAVFQADIDHNPLLIKQFRLPTRFRQLRYGLRRSRARRCWAAAEALRTAGLPTPEPLAFIECRRHGRPCVAYYICRYMAEAVPARRWIKAWYHQRPDAFRADFRRQILSCLDDLYSRRIYHADTKAGNLLLMHPDQPERRQFWWIDLDSVRFGVTPTRRRIVRNLVQLNGSIGSKVSEEDRMDFLHELARLYPHALTPGIANTIRSRTRKRLQRELDGICGP